MKKYYFKKILNLFIVMLFIMVLYNFICNSFVYIKSYAELQVAFTDLMASDSVIGNITGFVYETFFGSTQNAFSIYGSMVFGNFMYYLVILGIPFLIVYIILRVMLLITSWGGKINV